MAPKMHQIPYKSVKNYIQNPDTPAKSVTRSIPRLTIRTRKMKMIRKNTVNIMKRKIFRGTFRIQAPVSPNASVQQLQSKRGS